MPERDWKLEPPARPLLWLLLAVIVLTALVLRTYELDRFPPGPYYDEAAAAILAGQVASGRYLPIFITSYTGHEVLYYYLAAVVMRLAGATVWALRLTSALAGTATVALTYLLGRELFEDESRPATASWAAWLGLFAAALMATSFWHISVSRYGFRAITLPLAECLALWALWHGLRRSSWKWMIAAGVLCGLIAYTYLASRIAPVALAIVALMALVAERNKWRMRLAQLAVLTLVALAVLAPLGIFFLNHPETFTARTEQVSVFSADGAWQATIARNTLRALQVFTIRGDPDIRLNLSQQPMFQGALALAFYAGLIAVIVWPARISSGLGRVRYGLLIIWTLVMLLPTILSDPAQVPHSLRAIGIMPLVFFIPAMGIAAAAVLIRRALRNERVTLVLTTAALALTLGASAIKTFQDYVHWASQPRLYYENDGDLADMARYLNSLEDDQRALYVSAPDYRHPTVAALARNYDRIKWVQGGELFVFPPGPAIYALPQAAMPDSLWLELFFPPESHVTQGDGPDGAPAFLVHARDRPPAIAPTHPLSVTFGGVIQAIGYDVLRDRPSGGRTDVAVYWRILGKPDRGDYSEFITLGDDWGMSWAQGGSFAYPSEQWAPGEIIAERVRVQTEDGTPPGRYMLELGWWSASTGQRLPVLDAQGRFAGTTTTIGPITVTRRTRALDLSALNISHRLDTDWSGLRLLGFDQWPATVRQGEAEFVTLYWQADVTPLPDRQVTLLMRGADQRVTTLARDGPVHGRYPTSQWEAGELVADRVALRIPPDTPPGSYTLEAQMDGGPAQPLGRFDVQAIARNWAPPASSHPMSITLSDQVALVGYEAKCQISNIKCQEVTLTLHWQALREMDESYTVFAHLVDRNGEVRAQRDSAPMSGSYPTTLWQPGEFVTDVHTIPVPCDLPPGDYVLEVGLYLADTGARLAVAGNGDRILLDKVILVP
jgi:4-amino-4-deoxy-L-arabinose transferase-like glycosyltransferase/peptidoglycan/xylan/chitin deacetylase (PgdA/CDA1 family)